MYLLILAYLIYIPTSQPVLTDISGFHINLFLMLSSWDLWNDGCKSKTRLYKGDKVTSGKHFVQSIASMSIFDSSYAL